MQLHTFEMPLHIGFYIIYIVNSLKEKKILKLWGRDCKLEQINCFIWLDLFDWSMSKYYRAYSILYDTQQIKKLIISKQGMKKTDKYQKKNLI